MKQNSQATYKDTLFRSLFREEHRAIELCNALEGTNYPQNAKVRLCNLEDSLALRYNDSAIAIENELLVFSEHQSTLNPNVPLRFIPYTANTLFSWFVESRELYKNTQAMIPTPKYYVLYNGKEELKNDVLKLSDSFISKHGEITLELIVKVIDVRYGSGSVALEKSPSLNGYAYLISLIEKYHRGEGLTRDKAIHLAIEQCISDGILVEFLENNFLEVARMLGWEYSREEEELAIKEESEAKGEARGEARGRVEGKIEGKIELYFTELGLTIKQIAEKMNLGEEDVNKTLNKLGLA